MKKTFFIAVLCICAAVIIGCTNQTNETEQTSKAKKQIVTTLFPQYDFAKQIVGDRMDVSLLLPLGVESHAFEPTPKDIINIQNASLFIYTGENMELWTQKLLTDLDTKKTKVVDISANLPLIEAETHDHTYEFEEGHDQEYEIHVPHDQTEQNKKTHDQKDGAEESAHQEYEFEEGHEQYDIEVSNDAHNHSNIDPHVWTSPSNAKIILQDILQAVIEMDPDNREFYTANAASYMKQLESVEQEIQQIVDSGKRKKIIFAGHFALSYFAKQYGLEYVAAYPSTSSDAEPSIEDIADIIDQIQTEKIPVIYYEELVDPKVAKSIQEQTGAKILLLHSLHNVSKDEFDQGVTYVSLMQQNAKNLKEGLN